MPHKHVTIVAVPFTDTTSPIMAPALLKGVVNKTNISCNAIDLNALVYQRLQAHPCATDLINFLYLGKVEPLAIDHINELFEFMVEKIMHNRPSLVCLCVLHYQCKISARWLCFLLKKYHPEVEILIGGPGINDDINSNTTFYADELKNQGLIDHYISGDGEESLYQFLLGNLNYPGIDSMTWRAIENLNDLPYPDYDDYDFSSYTTPFLGVLGSRGCVRKCTFCDVHEHWDRFNWRSGENIFEEMLYQNRKHGSRYFKFQDNLINGNVKEYKKLITLLAQHNNENPDNSFHWVSYFIFRPAAHMAEEYWRLTAESGAYTLNVGVESLVEKTRLHMKKKFNNQDLIYNLEMAKKYNIKVFFILLIGYPTETNADHLETLDWIRENNRYAGNPITQISVGGTVSILPNTWLHQNQESLGITWKSHAMSTETGMTSLWEVKSIGNDYDTRVIRLNETIKVGIENGFDIHYAAIDPQKELEIALGNKMKTHVTKTHN